MMVFLSSLAVLVSAKNDKHPIKNEAVRVAVTYTMGAVVYHRNPSSDPT